MAEAVLRKGNLYNPLTKTIDNFLLDSDQYDLEITVDGKTSYYRVRYNNSYFDAEEVKPESFTVHKYNDGPTPPVELSSFAKTELYKEKIREKHYFPAISPKATPSFYAFLQRKRGKQNINNSKRVYSFTLPSLGIREKSDVSYYDIGIELANNKYYVIFITERVNEYGLQRDEPLYMIYEKKEWKKMKESIDEAVLDIAIKEDYPLNLLQYIYITTGGDYKLLSEFFHKLETTKSIEELLKDELTRKLIGKNEEIREELIKYLSGEQEDIAFTYKRR